MSVCFTHVIHAKSFVNRQHMCYMVVWRLSELFCAVLCIEVVQSHKHTYTSSCSL